MTRETLLSREHVRNEKLHYCINYIKYWIVHEYFLVETSAHRKQSSSLFEVDPSSIMVRGAWAFFNCEINLFLIVLEIDIAIIFAE